MLKVLECFAGIGAASKALTNLGIEHEIVDAVEIDKYAVKSFNAVHGTDFEPQDITEWDKDIECDLIMHGSPCQDFSVAGKQAGGDKDSGTRSSLMYETLRIVGKLKPEYVIWENVKNLLSKKHRHNFDAYLETMEKFGYKNYHQVLDAQNYGVPQHRERVFTVSILGGGDFQFPEPIPLEKKLKDVLEKEVDEKYYLPEERLESIIRTDRQGLKVKTLEPHYTEESLKRIKNNIVEGDIIPTLTANAMQSFNHNNCVMIKTANKTGYDLATDGDGIDLAYPDSMTRRGRVGHGVAKTLPTSDSQGVMDGYRIRKLTPLECWRLMGFDDDDFDKAQKMNSNTQLYKQAGNSIVVDVLMAIFRELFNGQASRE